MSDRFTSTIDAARRWWLITPHATNTLPEDIKAVWVTGPCTLAVEGQDGNAILWPVGGEGLLPIVPRRVLVSGTTIPAGVLVIGLAG